MRIVCFHFSKMKSCVETNQFIWRTVIQKRREQAKSGRRMNWNLPHQSMVKDAVFKELQLKMHNGAKSQRS